MKVLRKKQVIALQNQLIDRYGGVHGIRDEGLLDAALNAPFQTFGGSDLYPDTIETASRLGFELIKCHAFIDGNKRIGTHVMLVFLKLNGISIRYSDKELIQIILDIASGTSDCDALLEWLRKHREE